MHGQQVKRVWVAGSMGLLVLGLGLGLAFWAYQVEQQTLRLELTHNAEIVGHNLWQVLRLGMANNDHAEVRQTVASVVGRDAVVQARIIGLNGKVYADSSGELQGSNIMPTYPGCAVCHQFTELPTVAALPFLPTRLRVAIPIANESTCNSCHNVPNRSALGVVLVDVDLAEREARARTNLALAGLGALAGGLLVVWAVSGFPRPARWPALKWRWPHAPTPQGLGRVAPWLWLSALGVLVLLAGGGFTVVHLEEEAAFCASCHTQPETIYVQRAQNAPVDLASAHAQAEVACVACHSGAGVLGRADALLLGAQNVVRFVTGNYQSPTRSLTPIHTDHCTKCHAAVFTTLNASNHFHYFSQRWAQPTACVACHPAHPTDRTHATRYTSANAMQATCTQCHQQIVAGE